MRAVNLMPRDGRSKGSSSARGSSVAVYVLLGGLAALVVCAAVWATANKQAGDRRAQLQRVTAQAAAAEQRASRSAPYVQFERLARDRVQTVTTLSSTRFDWAHAMRELGRVVPADVWLTGLNGASGATDGSPSAATSAAPRPVVTLEGCTRSQAKVASLMARLRTVDGVRAVRLKTSEKPDSTGDESCPANRVSDPRFTIAVSFAIPGAAREGVDGTGQITTPSAAPGLRANQTAAAIAVTEDG